MVSEKVLENLQTIEPISLDVYHTNIKSINAKQLDSNSRFIRVSCTEHGKKLTLNKDTMFSYVRFKKPDGNAVLNFCTILPDGTLVFELTQQMLAVHGKAVADIMVFEAKIVEKDNGNIEIPEDYTDMNGFTVTYNEDADDVSIIYNKEKELTHSITSIEEIEKINLPLLSTMTLYVNILPNAINHAEIVSSYEYEALVGGLSKLGAIEFDIRDKELAREKEEESRVKAEEARETDCREAIKDCNEATSSANGAKQEALEAAQEVKDNIDNWNTATENASEAASNAQNAVANANIAISKCQEIIDKGVVLSTEKGVKNGVATLDENRTIPVNQLDIALAKIKVDDDNPENTLLNLLKELQQSIDNIHKVYHGYDNPNDPDNTTVVGSKDGDIYMKIIEDDTMAVG